MRLHLKSLFWKLRKYWMNVLKIGSELLLKYSVCWMKSHSAYSIVNELLCINWSTAWVYGLFFPSDLLISRCESGRGNNWAFVPNFCACWINCCACVQGWSGRVVEQTARNAGSAWWSWDIGESAFQFDGWSPKAWS